MATSIAHSNGHTPHVSTLVSELYGDRPATPTQQAAQTITFDATWTAAVKRVSELAQARLPEALHGRIQRGTALVLSGGVVIEEDGHTCQVRASDGKRWYSANGSCPCEDHQRAPEHLCKHRLARGIYLRAGALLREGLPPVAPQDLCGTEAPDLKSGGEELPTPAQPTSKVPAQYISMIQGKPFVRFAGLLQMAHERGLVELTEKWTYNDAGLSLAEAVATFKDGLHFMGSGDASPDNVTRKVAPHFRRVALTRAKARCLRDALGIDLVAVEEIAED